MEALIFLLIFLLGLCVGSFLNVVIDRIPQKKSVIKNRSHCDSCKKILAWYDLVPVASFIFLQGRCRYCHSKLSWQYPVVELATGLLFLFIFSLYVAKASSFAPLPFILSSIEGNVVSIVFLLIVFSLLLAILVIDIKYGIIPDAILFPITFLTFGFLILNSEFLIPAFLSGVISFLLFLLIVFATKGRGMGFGDVKYAFFMGTFLGFPRIIIGIYAAFLTGAVLSLILIVVRKKRFGQTIPFGPFLVIGTFVGYFWGPGLVDRFFSFLVY